MRRRGDVVGSRQKEDYTTLKKYVYRLFPWRRPDVEATPNYLEGRPTTPIIVSRTLWNAINVDNHLWAFFDFEKHAV